MYIYTYIHTILHYDICKSINLIQKYKDKQFGKLSFATIFTNTYRLLILNMYVHERTNLKEVYFSLSIYILFS